MMEQHRFLLVVSLLVAPLAVAEHQAGAVNSEGQRVGIRDSRNSENLDESGVPSGGVGINVLSDRRVDPTGTKDSYAGIQAVLDRVPSSGGVVVIPDGEYRTSHALVPKGSRGGRTLVWLSPGAVIRLTSGAPGDSVFDITQEVGPGGSLEIQGGQLTQSGSTPLNGIKIHVQNTTVSGVKIDRMKGDGIRFVHDLAVPPIVCRLRGNTIISNDGTGIAVLVASSGLTIDQSRIEQNGREGILLDGAGNVIVSENVIEGNGRLDTGAPNLRIVGDGPAAKTDVHGNHFESNRNQAHSEVSIEGRSFPVALTEVHGNTFVGYRVAGGAGVTVGTLGAVYSTQIHGNLFYGMGAGIVIGKFSSRHRIYGNGWSSSFGSDASTSRVKNSAPSRAGVISDIENGDADVVDDSSQHRGSPPSAPLPVYSGNAAAVAAGLTAGQWYRTETGQLMIVY